MKIRSPNLGVSAQRGGRSNVDATETMAEMMNAYRAFEANQRVLQAYDQSLQKAVNEIGRLG